MKEKKKNTADTLKIGDKAKVLELDVESKEIKRHLLDMGITRGVEIMIKKKAPMGDPVDISLRDYELCVSKKELSSIVVEVIK
jgi:ferrous iron transport protein A